MSFNTANAAAIAAKDAFIKDIREQLSLHEYALNNKSFESLKIRVKTANSLAKIINNGLTSVFDTMLAMNTSSSNGRLLSTFYLKMHEMMIDSLNAHRRDYVNGEKEIIKIQDYALRLNKNARKCLYIVYNLMSKINNKRDIPSYDEIVSKHNTVISKYSLRPRKPVNYTEDEDANFDDASDEDYIDEEEVIISNKDEVIVSNEVIIRPKRNIPVIDYTGMDTEKEEYDEDYLPMDDEEDDEKFEFCVNDDNDDNDSEYFPDNEEELDDDHVLNFDDDDYAEESEEDDDDYEDDDEYRQEDKNFLDEYYNDTDYNDSDYKVNKNIKNNNDDDDEYNPSDDEESEDDHILEFDEDDYAEESEEDDDDYEDEDELRKEDLEFLKDYHNDSDYKVNNDDNDDDDDSEYIPNAEDELEDDHILDFDDDDYAEESEEEDDDYEDESDSDNDRQFVSDYFNDPDYNPDEDVEELEYDFSFKSKTNALKKSNDLVLKAGIEEDEDYNPEDDNEDDDDEEEVMYSCKKDNRIVVCKRFYDKKTGRVHYRWINMSQAEYANKYDEEYTEEDN